jgi:hypothetical protein
MDRTHLRSVALVKTRHGREEGSVLAKGWVSKTFAHWEPAKDRLAWRSFTGCLGACTLGVSLLPPPVCEVRVRDEIGVHARPLL